MSLRRGAQPRCLSFGFAFDYELFRLIVRELLSSFSHSALHRVASSLSLSLDSSFFPFFLSLSGRFESGRGSAGSRRVTLPAYHFRGLPFSATTHTKGGGGPPSPLCVGAHTRQKWHSFLQYRASRAPQRCVSSLREILTRIEYKKIYNARSIIMKQAESSPPAVYLIPSLFPFYNTRLSFSLSLSVFACFFLLRGSNDFYYYLLSNSLG